MTRETKIGLLVGLAFIIVVGILFSDYMTSANQDRLAPLQQAGNNVRSGLGQPTSDNASPVVVVPNNVTPQQTVLTRDELNPRPQPVRPQPPITVIGRGSDQGDVLKNNQIPQGLNDVARRNNEELVQVDSGNGSVRTLPLTNNTAPAPVKTTVNSYKAASGDSLIKIAKKVYGTGSRAACDAIVAANPALQDNPNRIIVGHSYVIPPFNGNHPTAAATTDDTSTVVTLTPAAPKTASQPEYTYTVKGGDSLWSIARDELGNIGTVAALKELNSEVLKGANHDRVIAGMTLRLPAKPVASAN